VSADRPVGKRRAEDQTDFLPEAPPNDSNAHEIITQAKSIQARGDIEEAIKLMCLAVGLQPNQPKLVIHLLELYHKTRQAELFADLMDGSRTVLEAMSPSSQIHLHVMHTQLCPDLVFPLKQVDSINNNDVVTEGLPEPEIDEARQPDKMTEVDSPSSDLEPEFEIGMEADDEFALDALAIRASDSFDDIHIDADEDEAYLATQVILTDNGVSLRDESMPMAGEDGETHDMAVILKEADVYLTYGLYDNAQELLLKGMEVDPKRADFLARLLDSYYATRNVVDFVAYAKVMLDMGDTGEEYWDKVKTMGYELSPLNKMFAGGKGGSLSTVEREIHTGVMVGEILNLEVTLKEADVYLAYGLYDNAQELLLRGMEVDPERTDFLARLLDSYYATRNVVDFVAYAKVMLDMGDSGSEYWDKVETMGYELAPFNKIFAGGKDTSLSTVELETPKPETADIDFSDIEEDSEAAFADIEIDGDDDSSPTDLNFDLELSEFDDPAGDELDDLIIELDQSEESEVSDIPDSEAALAVNLEPTEDDLDAVLAVNAEATEDELDAVLAVDLEAAEDELDAMLAAETQDDDEVIDLDYGAEDAVQFTMEEEIKSEQLAADDGNDTNLVLVEEPKPDSLPHVKLDSGDGRIFYFPENPSEDKEFDEFESEVKMTLQAIRDQLQNMTERLFHQERATNDLQQTIAELKDGSSASEAGKNKKLS
jgi:tetratricopeptide (TPR) repeat protein